MLDLDLILKWIIILLGTALIITLILVPKDDCDVCNFDGLNGKEFFKEYEERCLKKSGELSLLPRVKNITFLDKD